MRREHITEAIEEYDVQSVDTLIGDITPPHELMATLTARKIAEEQEKTYVTEQKTQRQRQDLERQKALSDKQRELVNSEQDVRVAEMRANASIQQASGESQAMARKAEGEASAKRRVGEAEAEVVAIKGRNEGEAIRAVGSAKADAYKLGVEAMGGNYALLQIFTALAERNIRLTPDVLVQGSNGSGGSSDGLLAVVLRELLVKNGLQQPPADKAA
jgi:regulator of protease activity HflC (stomatin/prohibitin superfamily)